MRVAGVRSVRLESTRRAEARASGAGGYSGRGIAITVKPAAAAERRPLEESSMAAQDFGGTERRSAAAR